MAKVNPCICFTYDLLYFTYGIFALQEGLHFMPKILVKNRACLFSLSLHLPSTWLWYALIMFPSSMSCSHVVELSKGGPVGYLWLFRAGFLICGEIRIAYPDFPCPNYSNFSWQTLNGPAVTCKTFSYKLQPRVSNQNGNPHKHTHNYKKQDKQAKPRADDNMGDNCPNGNGDKNKNSMGNSISIHYDNRNMETHPLHKIYIYVIYTHGFDKYKR